MAWSWWDAPMASSTASSGLMQAVFSTGATGISPSTSFNLSPKNKTYCGDVFMIHAMYFNRFFFLVCHWVAHQDILLIAFLEETQ